MRKTGKPRDSIRVYHAVGDKTKKTKMQNMLLAASRAAVVWFSIAAWWEVLVSWIPSPVKRPVLYLVFFLLAVLSAGVFCSRRKWGWFLAYLGSAAWLLWKRRRLLASVVNYMANSYLLKKVSSIVPSQEGVKDLYICIQTAKNSGIALYDVEKISEWQMAAVLGIFLLPFLFYWMAVLYFQKGKLFSLLLLLVPVLFLTVERTLPSVWAGWMLLVAGAVYCAAFDGDSGLVICARAAVAACVLGLLAVPLILLGKPLEAQKTVEGGIYQETRAFIHEDLLVKIEEIWRKQTKEAQKAVEKVRPELPKQEEPRTQDPKEPEPLFSFEGAKDSVSAMQNLKDLEVYRPGTGTCMYLSMAEKPEGTVYYPLSYGGSYWDGNWEEIVSAEEGGPERIWTGEGLDDTVFDAYLEYTGSLERLTEFCQEWKNAPLDQISSFIQKEFEERTVYDYAPGPTPADRDFAEYFLFENKKGFCVHFASTAVLIYRICGYPARYVNGFAVPAGAFVRQEDDTYKAQVKGTMGHAWCEVYDGRWIRKEHTLAYTGEAPDWSLPAADSKTEAQDPGINKAKEQVVGYTAVLGSVITGGLVLLLFCVLRVFIVKKKRLLSFQNPHEEKGIQNVYRSVCEIARFFGAEKGNPLGQREYEEIKTLCPADSIEELDWLYATVLETMFYKKKTGWEERSRAEKFYRRFSEEMKRELSGFKKFRYKYVKCF